MPSQIDKITWIVTELLFGIAGLIYGSYGLISNLIDNKKLLVQPGDIVFVVIASVGFILLVMVLIQIRLLKSRKPQRKQQVVKSIKYCASCGNKLKKEEEFCSKCGEELSKIKKIAFCPSCGVKKSKKDEFCSKCGYALSFSS